jgi:hypothetical protein
MHVNLFSLLSCLFSFLVASSTFVTATSQVEKRLVKCKPSSQVLTPANAWSGPKVMKANRDATTWYYLGGSTTNLNPDFAASFTPGRMTLHAIIQKGQYNVLIKTHLGEMKYWINGGDDCYVTPGPSQVTDIDVYSRVYK